MSKYIFLDRDGVINKDSKDYIKSPSEWIPIESSIQAIAKLSAANYKIVVITNQSGIGRGFYSIETLKNIHKKMCDTVEAVGGKIERIYFCPHHPDDNCLCRKPKPQMLLQAINELNVKEPSLCFMVGDSLRDLQSANDANIPPVLVLTGNGQRTIHKHEKDLPTNTMVKENLLSFAEFLLNRNM